MNECIFCKIINGEISAEKIYEDEKVFAFLDVRPQNKGHVLVVPKKHFANIEETSEETLCELSKKIKILSPKVVEGVGADAYNVGINNGVEAGQVIEHIHIHIIPRFHNDNLKHWLSKEYQEGEKEEVANKIKAVINN